MGKVRTRRQKYHLSLKKSKSLNNITEIEEEEKQNETEDSLFPTSQRNIFAGMKISLDDLSKSLPADFDVRSMASAKSRKELKEEERHLKKKEKKKLRHERFIKKLDVTNQLMKNTKAKKKKQMSLCGDLSPLLKALPSLQALEGFEEYRNPNVDMRGIQKANVRVLQQSADAKIFREILDDKKFQCNPISVIGQLLKQKVATET